jgi:O-antigen ligase
MKNGPTAVGMSLFRRAAAHQPRAQYQPPWTPEESASRAAGIRLPGDDTMNDGESSAMPALTRNSDRAAAMRNGEAARGLLVAIAAGATLLLPVALLYSRAIGDGLLTGIAVLFIASHRTGRDWSWLRTPWTRLALLLWGWMLLCSLLSGTVQQIEQAVVALRFFLFVAALENWVLAGPRARRRLWYVILAVALWILVESWHQYVFGVNVFGYPRWGDGALTGPFEAPRAGGTYLMVFFPAFLPLCFLLLNRKGRFDWIYGIGVLVVAAATMILIGQRMPALLLALGLCASGLLFRRFRLPIVLTIGISIVLLALMPVLSPPAFAKLVVRFTQQMQHFWETPYGLIFARAVTMIQANPWMGLGWDGYRNGCMEPRYLSGLSWLPVSDPASILGCNIHPHSYWLQVGTSAGLPGIALFGALVVAWLWRIRGGAGYLANDRRAALLIIVFVAMWPIASTTSLFTVPNAGWVFLMIGWGLAEARADKITASA